MGHLLKCLIPTIGCPQTLNGEEGRYALAAFYCGLLGMKIVNEGWLLIADGKPGKFYIALDGDGWDEERPPRWPDPEYPQQLHLDVVVPDVEAAGVLATGLGATLLRDNGTFRVYADPVGHPFCLYPDPSAEKPMVGRVVFDCFSPRAVASFYEGFLGARGRVEDSSERVVVDLGDDTLPQLAFQHAQFRAARWPDSAYPAQLHLDYRWHDGLTARTALERAESLGAIRLPQLGGAEVYADPASHPFCIQNEIPVVFDIAGLYLNPPDYAVVYCVDETSREQAWDRPQQARAKSAGTPKPKAGLLAALNVTDALTPPPERTAAFESFLADVDSKVPSHLSVNLVYDWDATYNDAAVQSWLADHPRVQIHRNPPDCGWHQQVERWLTYVTDEFARRGDHTSADALDSAFHAWAQAWNDQPQPFVWTKTAEHILRSLQRREDYG
jgi:hypothetical protein